MRFVKKCQICGSTNLDQTLSLGYMPPVNQMIRIGERAQHDWLPTDLLYCNDCTLVQLGVIADKETVFPRDYPYTSGTTKLLRDNFKNLQTECETMLGLRRHLVVDIGSNDGTLLAEFQAAGQTVVGIEPTDVAKIAAKKGITTVQSFFDKQAADAIINKFGKAKLITMTNCFAHIEDVHQAIENVKRLLAPDGVFVTESHYVLDLLNGLQFDAIYHEHLRYYSLRTLEKLFLMHDLHIIHDKHIPTHGGSIRVYVSRQPGATAATNVEPVNVRPRLAKFAHDIRQLKCRALIELATCKMAGYRIVGLSAPSRAATLVNYFGLDEDIIDCVYEVKGSLKIGRYMPGTQIPICDEKELFEEIEPDTCVIFSWHIADELVPKIRQRGYRGNVLIPIPDMRTAA